MPNALMHLALRICAHFLHPLLHRSQAAGGVVHWYGAHKQGNAAVSKTIEPLSQKTEAQHTVNIAAVAPAPVLDAPAPARRRSPTPASPTHSDIVSAAHAFVWQTC
jgi:hypothetical protein